MHNKLSYIADHKKTICYCKYLELTTIKTDIIIRNILNINSLNLEKNIYKYNK